MVSEKAYQRVQDIESRPDTRNQPATCVIRAMWDNNDEAE